MSHGMSGWSLVISARGHSHLGQMNHRHLNRPTLLKTEVAQRVACHVFVIFHTERNECEKKNWILKKIFDLCFETP